MKLKDEIKNIDTSVKKLREFGLLVGGVFLSLGGLMAWRGKPSAPIFFALGGFLFLFGVARPQVLRYIYIFWMAFATSDESSGNVTCLILYCFPGFTIYSAVAFLPFLVESDSTCTLKKPLFSV